MLFFASAPATPIAALRAQAVALLAAALASATAPTPQQLLAAQVLAALGPG